MDFPIEANHNLALASGQELDEPSRYSCLVGCLMYLTITCHELCYAIHVLSQFVQKSKIEYIDATSNVLKYIKGAPTHDYNNLHVTAF